MHDIPRVTVGVLLDVMARPALAQRFHPAVIVAEHIELRKKVDGRRALALTPLHVRHVTHRQSRHVHTLRQQFREPTLERFRCAQHFLDRRGDAFRGAERPQDFCAPRRAAEIQRLQPRQRQVLIRPRPDIRDGPNTFPRLRTQDISLKTYIRSNLPPLKLFHVLVVGEEMDFRAIRQHEDAVREPVGRRVRDFEHLAPIFLAVEPLQFRRQKFPQQFLLRADARAHVVLKAPDHRLAMRQRALHHPFRSPLRLGRALATGHIHQRVLAQQLVRILPILQLKTISQRIAIIERKRDTFLPLLEQRIQQRMAIRHPQRRHQFVIRRPAQQRMRRSPPRSPRHCQQFFICRFSNHSYFNPPTSVS